VFITKEVDMKKLVGLAVLGLAMGFGLGAEDLKGWVDSRASVKVADLTVGDLKALADIESVDRQKSRYVFGSAVASFLVPGLGQFKTGDAWAGTWNLAAHTALVGATIYGAWVLLPEDVRAAGWNHDARRDLMRNYFTNDFGKIAPALGVMAGGAVVSMAFRFWSSHDAKTRALENLNSGSVTFEPAAIDGHFGMMARMQPW
jgi:hypothetical protein